LGSNGESAWNWRLDGRGDFPRHWWLVVSGRNRDDALDEADYLCSEVARMTLSVGDSDGSAVANAPISEKHVKRQFETMFRIPFI
jgi:hypothetical protein